MTLRALARGSIVVTLANLVPRAGAFLLLPIYARFLTRADFGTVSLASSAALLLTVLCRLGLDAALLRLHFDAGGAPRRQLYATVAAICLGAVAVAVIAGMLVGMAVVGTDDPAGLAVWMLALAITAANTFQFVPSAWLRATEQHGRYLGLALAAFGAVVAVTVTLVVVVRLGAIGSLAGQLAGAMVMAAAAALILWRMRPWSVERATGRRALRFGLPLLPHTAAGWLLNVSDRWLLLMLLAVPASQALAAIGVYSLGYQLGYVVGLTAISFNAAWLPFFYRVGEGTHGAAILRDTTVTVIGGFAWLAGALAVLAPDVVAVMAPEEWAAAADVTAIVAFASAANATALMLASELYLRRDTGVVPVLTLVAVAVNVALNLVLVPWIGIMGAAWATLAAYGTLAVLTGITARRRYRIGIDGARLAAVAVAALAPTVIARAFVVPEADAVGVAWRLALAAAAAVAIIAIVRAPIRRLQSTVRDEHLERGAAEGGPAGAVG